MFNKKILVPTAAALMIGLGVFGVGQISAQSDDMHSTMIQKLSQKLGISEDKINSAFEQIHSERKSERKAFLEQKLNQAVNDGKVTDAQKQAILNKFSEMKDFKVDKDSFKNMTAEQRRNAMQQKKQEMESWAAQNGLSLEILHELMGHGRGGFRMKMAD